MAVALEDVQAASRIHGDGPGVQQRRGQGVGAVGGDALVAAAGDRGDHARAEVDGAHPPVAEIHDEQPLARAIQVQAKHAREGGVLGRTTVTGKRLGAGARQRLDHAGGRVQGAHPVVEGVGDVDGAALGADDHVVRPVQLRRRSRPAVTAVGLLARAGDGRDDAGAVHPPQAVAQVFGDEQVPSAVAGHSERVSQLRLQRR
jgi:hypothetical protein